MEQKRPMLGEFILLETLGTGATAKYIFFFCNIIICKKSQAGISSDYFSLLCNKNYEANLCYPQNQ